MSSVKQKTVICNWKMNGTDESITSHIKSLSTYPLTTDVAEVSLCLPFVYLQLGIMHRNDMENNNILIGAQTCHEDTDGAHTGSISMPILDDIDCDLVIVGHSEDRRNNKLSFINIKDRIKAIEKYGMYICLCIGEMQRGASISGLIEELKFYFEGNDIYRQNQGHGIIIAYEPIWAIGTGVLPSNDEIGNAIGAIRNTMQKMGYIRARIIYGGSVNASSAKQIVMQCNTDGVMLGKASLSSEEVLKILDEVNNV